MNGDSELKDEAYKNEEEIEQSAKDKESKNEDHLGPFENYFNCQENQEEKLTEEDMKKIRKVQKNKDNHDNNWINIREMDLEFDNLFDVENHLNSSIYDTEKTIKDSTTTQKSEIKQEETKMIISKNLMDTTENDISHKNINSKEKDLEQKEKDEINEKSENEPKTEKITNNKGKNFSNEFNSFSNIVEKEQTFINHSRAMSLDDCIDNSNYCNNQKDEKCIYDINNSEAKAPTENNLINYNCDDNEKGNCIGSLAPSDSNKEKSNCFGDNSKKF